MSLFAIADTHLSLSADKPMDIFGARWKGYTERLENEWKSVVRDEDTVVVAGDISWAMTTEEAKADFDFLEALPGRKIILKGNHDYWWQTMAKLSAFVENNEYKTINFLHNNAYACEDFIICGSRGWYNDDKNITMRGADSEKIVAREVMRLRISFEEGKKLQKELFESDGKMREMLAFMHFPPIFKGYICDEIIMELYRNEISRCFFGHIHGCYESPLKINYADIDFYFISADYLAFRPYKIDVKNT